MFESASLISCKNNENSETDTHVKKHRKKKETKKGNEDDAGKRQY